VTNSNLLKFPRDQRDDHWWESSPVIVRWEVELQKLADRDPERYHRFLFDSTPHTTIGADRPGGGIPCVSATFDTTVVDGTSVATWLQLPIDGDPDFGDRIESRIGARFVGSWPGHDRPSHRLVLAVSAAPHRLRQAE
jgi:hypothetical protein